MEVFVSFLFPILMFGGIFALVLFINKHFFKELLSQFETVSGLPGNSIRLGELRYRNSRLRNAVSIGEEGEAMIIKIMLIPPFKIPYSAFSKIEHNGNYATFSFKKKELAPIQISLTKEQLEKFPRMRSQMIQGSKVEPLEEEEEYPSSLSIGKTNYTEVIPPLNPTQLKSSAGNWFRGILLLIVILGAAFYIRDHFGLFGL